MRTLPGRAGEGGGDGSRARRSRHHRNAASVLPLPVGAWISVWRPAAIAGQPPTWAGVCSANAPSNQARTGGEKGARGAAGRGAHQTVGACAGMKHCMGITGPDEGNVPNQMRRRCWSGRQREGSYMRNYRKWATPLALLAAALVLWMEVPIEEVRPETLGGDSLRQIVTIAFWVLAIVVVALMFTARGTPEAQVVEVEGPAFTRYLFSNTRAGLFWLPVRLFLGFSWIESGPGKAFNPDNA